MDQTSADVQPAQAHAVHSVLPEGAAGQWCRVTLVLPARTLWWARLELTDEVRGQIVRACFLSAARPRPGGCARGTLVHVPAASRRIEVQIYGASAKGAVLHVRVLNRAAAALALLWRGRALLPCALAGSARGRLGRVRAVLGQAPVRQGEAPPYESWVTLCEASLPPPLPAPGLAHRVVVLGAGNGAGAAADAPWSVVMRPGDVLAPQAFAWFAQAAAVFPDADLITADCDRLSSEGARMDPLLKPPPDRLLLRTALPTRGAFALRCAAAPATEAEARHMAMHARRPVHIARILTHCASVAETFAPAEAVARDSQFLPHVTALVPSALRGAHVFGCLRRVVTETAYDAFDVQVLLSNPRGAKPGLARRVQRLPRTKIAEFPLQDFNYAAVNNAAAAQLPADDNNFLLLLNDDVAPLRGLGGRLWLDAMVAHMQDPSVGIVGARLLYGNDMVQHEGVIMGLAHLCEHAGRLLPGNDGGPYGIGLLDREVSAVTAACLLIRAGLYRALGGMDSGFAIALNDVDLCLRARAAGWRIVYCAQAVLYHYESLSLGRHYEGARAALEAGEVQALRRRWAPVIAADPCYSPLASLEPGREWQPAFPPRETCIMAAPANDPATG